MLARQFAKEFWYNKIRNSKLNDFRWIDSNHVSYESEIKTLDFPIDDLIAKRVYEVAGGNAHGELILLGAAFNLLLTKYKMCPCLAVYPIGTSEEAQRFIFVDFSKQSGTIKELIQNIRIQWEESFEHHDYDIDQLFRMLENNGIGSRQQLNKISIGHSELENYDEKKFSRFEISILSVTSEKGSMVRIMYKSLIYSDDFVSHLGMDLLKCLAITVQNMSMPVDEVVLLADHEFEQQKKINDTALVYWRDRTIVHLFEDQVHKRPDKVALSIGYNQVSYSELSRLVDLLVVELRESGVMPGNIIGLNMSRSIEMIAGLLAILKCGASYLPIEGKWPYLRRKFVMKECSTKLLLVDRTRENDMYDGIKTHVVDFAGKEETIVSSQLNSANPNSLSYVIYTSGTTGNAKGVKVSHKALMNYLTWAARLYAPDESHAFAFHTAISFDLSVTSIFLPLFTGNSIRIYPQETPETIDTILKDPGVNVVKLTPSHLKIISKAKYENLSIKKLIVGGENLAFSLAEEVYLNFGKRIELYNEYGPTEAVVGCSVKKFEPKERDRGNMTIGRPMSNTELYILDEQLKPLPFGIPGELYISGECLAEGYMAKDALTQARFIENPFVSGTKMYRTGDIARFVFDKEIEVIGRADDQVKIRGYRVELAEIKNCLLKDKQISDCVVQYDHLSVSNNDSIFYCKKCGIASNYPDINFNHEGVCSICTGYFEYKGIAAKYFRSMTDLIQVFKNKQDSNSSYDCLMLLSGGKDSTYGLYQLVRELKLRVLVFSFDNGFISKEAKENINRTVAELGVRLVWGGTSFMKEVFEESIVRHSNVCNGCFKAIYTQAIDLAYKQRIRFIVTGLSRGQLFETRLHEIFKANIYEPEQVDEIILEARRSYHRAQDKVSQLVAAENVKVEDILDKVSFIDFYRYNDASLDEIYDYLGRFAPWTRPKDTGRSTNCLINDLGIFIHKKVKGYHNYALPYSWDVRLNHKSRQQALDELNDELDENRMNRLMTEIGLDRNTLWSSSERKLIAYIVTVPGSSISIYDVRSMLVEQLPEYMIPDHIVFIEKIPLTFNRKIDYAALTKIAIEETNVLSEIVHPSNDTQLRLLEIWKEVFSRSRIGINNDFHDLGGHSLKAAQIILKIYETFGINVDLKMILNNPTIEKLSNEIELLVASNKDDSRFTGFLEEIIQ